MGLFDSYQFDPASYQGGGLIDRLLTQLQPQTAYQNPQGPGFGAPENPLSYGQDRNVAVGNYQMPQFGNAPQPDPMNANAQMLPAQQTASAPVEQPNFFERPTSGGGFGGAMRGVLANAQAGPLGWIAGGIGGAMGMGQGSAQEQKRQLLEQQYKALVPVLGHQKAMLAIINPEAGKILVEEALSNKDKFSFTTLPDGTVIRQSTRTGEVAPAYQGQPKADWGVVSEVDGQKTYGWIDKNRRTVAPVGAVGEQSSTVMGPDGKPIAIPQGVDRQTFIKEVSRAGAKAAAGEKTEVQAKSEKFGNKMENAEKNLRGLDGEYTSTFGAGGFFRGTEYLPGGNSIQSENYQKYKQARDNFITALLRDESGAAIGTQEFNRYEKELFPQPGDAAEVVKQKAEARKIAIEAMKKSAGPGYKSPAGLGTEPGKTKTGVSWSVE